MAQHNEVTFEDEVCQALASEGWIYEPHRKSSELYDSAPYGIVVPKDQQALAEAIGGAFAAMEKSGDYKKVLEKWNNADGAVTAFPVNP